MGIENPPSSERQTKVVATVEGYLSKQSKENLRKIVSGELAPSIGERPTVVPEDDFTNEDVSQLYKVLASKHIEQIESGQDELDKTPTAAPERSGDALDIEPTAQPENAPAENAPSVGDEVTAVPEETGDALDTEPTAVPEANGDALDTEPTAQVEGNKKEEKPSIGDMPTGQV